MELAKKLGFVAVAAGMAVAASSAQAVTITDPGLQDVLDGITLGGTSTIDVNADQLDDGLDSYWAISGSGGSVSTFVIEISTSSLSNTFGIYDRTNSTNYVELFSGADVPAGGPAGSATQLTVTFAPDGSVILNGVDSGYDFAGNAFGYYLGSETAAGSPLFYSDSDLNTNGSDQMVAVQGNGVDQIQVPGFVGYSTFDSNEYLIAFDDQLLVNDSGDFDDLVVIVESVNPVSEPALLGLLGLGLAGIGAARRKKA